MSSLYNLEPPPTAKVLLNTTSGDLVLELFAKQAPLASRNFLQHCLDGYYDNTIFHRLVPGFIIQGGDPSGLGTGGVSAINNGAPFADEYHSRLKFTRRGLLGMANSGEPNDNTSQFFLTLDKTPELQGKNTMFGRIEGDTIYNLMKMAEADLAADGSDRPLYPTRIIGTEILVNPFDDMVKRVHTATSTKTNAPKPAKKKRKAAKNLLSFGADDDDDDGEAVAPLQKKAKVNPNFIAPVQDHEPSTSDRAPPRNAAKKTDSTSEKPVEKPAAVETPLPLPTVAQASHAANPAAPSRSSSCEPAQEKKEPSRLDKVNQQIADIKASMKRTTQPVRQDREDKKSALEAMIPATSTKGRKRGKVTDDRTSLDLFNAFKKRLEHVPESTSPTAPAEKDEGSGQKEDDTGTTTAAATSALDTEDALCDLHFIANCQSCIAWDKDATAAEDVEDDNDVHWMSHKLSFAKDTLGKDLEWRRKMDEFEVIDPREKAKELKEKKREKRGDGKDWERRREKDGRSAKT